MSRDPRRRAPRRASEHRVGLRRNGMPPIGGDGADLNSEMTMTSLRLLAQEVESLTDEERLEAIIAAVGALLELGEIIGPQYREMTDYMRTHDADEEHHDGQAFARIEGFLEWIHQLAPAEVVSLVATSASLLDFIRLARLDAPDKILELLRDDQPGE